MTSIAVTASKCANASEVVLLVACFIPSLPRFGHDSSLRENAQRRADYDLEHTKDSRRCVFALCRPHAANIDCAKVEQ